MKRMLAALWAALSSRALSPLVIGFFLLAYIVIAFFTEETLTVLIFLTGNYFILAVILFLLPLNIACRFCIEVRRYYTMRRALSRAVCLEPELYDEAVELAVTPVLDELAERLRVDGYRTRRNDDLLAAWRGVSLAPSRLVFLAGTFCLFAGIFVSLESRTVYRQSIIEGRPFPSPSGGGGLVERIVYRVASGPILAKELLVEVATGQGGVKRYGVYPPTLSDGAFAYPRYLGIALNYSFLAPELPGGYQNSGVFPIYPPGREATIVIPGSPYKVALTLAKPDDGSDPYMTGKLLFRVKLLKGPDVLFAGDIPQGGEFVRDGIRLSFPDARRMVITDFVVDFGVFLIWGAGCLFLLAGVVWLPVRLFFPRREMLFRGERNAVLACSHAEGRRRGHTGAFHAVLDQVAATQPGPSGT